MQDSPDQKGGPNRLHKGSGYYNDGHGFVWKDVTWISSSTTDGRFIQKVPTYWHAQATRPDVVVAHDNYQRIGRL